MRLQCSFLYPVVAGPPKGTQQSDEVLARAKPVELRFIRNDNLINQDLRQIILVV